MRPYERARTPNGSRREVSGAPAFGALSLAASLRTSEPGSLARIGVRRLNQTASLAFDDRRLKEQRSILRHKSSVEQSDSDDGVAINDLRKITAGGRLKT